MLRFNQEQAMKLIKYQNPRTGEVFILSSAKDNTKTINGVKFLLLAKENTERYLWMNSTTLQRV